MNDAERALAPKIFRANLLRVGTKAKDDHWTPIAKNYFKRVGGTVLEKLLAI